MLETGSHRAKPDAVSVKLAEAIDPEYWKVLFPAFHIEEMKWPEPGAPKAHAELSSEIQLTEQFRSEGWLKAAVFDPKLMDACARCLEAVVEAGWPPVFAFMYDEFWTLLKHPRLGLILSSILGADHKTRPFFWCHLVDPSKAQKGWPPHMDDLGPNGRDMVAVWIALTEANLNNGCMYVVPENRAPKGLVEGWRNTSIDFETSHGTLQSALAVPAVPGDTLIWHGHVLHWGSRTRQGAKPRLSLAFEFQKGSVATQGDMPTVLPSFSLRLYLLTEQIINYAGRFEERTIEPEVLALAKLMSFMIKNPLEDIR